MLTPQKTVDAIDAALDAASLARLPSRGGSPVSARSNLRPHQDDEINTHPAPNAGAETTKIRSSARPSSAESVIERAFRTA
jgi:hypothetical protein